MGNVEFTADYAVHKSDLPRGTLTQLYPDSVDRFRTAPAFRWFEGERLLEWEHTKDVPWGKAKVGPSTPPVRTDKGWLTLFHGVEMREPDQFGWRFTYRTGVMMLDLADPSKVIGICPDPIMEPTEEYERIGYRIAPEFYGCVQPARSGNERIGG